MVLIRPEKKSQQLRLFQQLAYCCDERNQILRIHSGEIFMKYEFIKGLKVLKTAAVHLAAEHVGFI